MMIGGPLISDSTRSLLVRSSAAVSICKVGSVTPVTLVVNVPGGDQVPSTVRVAPVVAVIGGDSRKPSTPFAFEAVKRISSGPQSARDAALPLGALPPPAMQAPRSRYEVAAGSGVTA